MQITKPIKKILERSFADLCLEGLFPSGEFGEPQFCKFCGAEKMAFTNPIDPKYRPGQKSTVILECECERKFKMLANFLEANKEWQNYPHSKPKNVPNYGVGPNAEERQRAHFALVMRVEQEYQAMVGKSQYAEIQPRMPQISKNPVLA